MRGLANIPLCTEFDADSATHINAHTHTTPHRGVDEYGEYEGDVLDPADIPLCTEFEADGACRGGDDCPLIHGDQCEVRGGYTRAMMQQLQQPAFGRSSRQQGLTRAGRGWQS